jgi:shikimate dehydrogenase
VSGRPYAEVIGDPIAHSKSPLIHNFWLKKLGIDAEYRACHVRADELADYFARRRGDAEWRGCNVTTPHKQTCLALLDGVHRKAREVGAVNTITVGKDHGLHGRNTDVDGIWRTLNAMESRDGKKVVVIGAGGAARAMCAALVPLSPSNVTIVNRSPDKASTLLNEFGFSGEARGFGILPRADLIVNASPLGMNGQPQLSVSLERQGPEAFVFDMVYAPQETPLLAEAKVRGLSATNGLTMLVEQAAVAFGCFFSASAPREHDAELRALLTA